MISNTPADLPEARPFDRASADMLYHGQDVSSAGGCFPARHSAWQLGGGSTAGAVRSVYPPSGVVGIFGVPTRGYRSIRS